jgi:hypothetical protein
LLSSRAPRPEATKIEDSENEIHSNEESQIKHRESQYASTIETKRRLRRLRAEELEIEMALAAKAEADRLAAEEARIAQRESDRNELLSWLEQNGYGSSVRATKKAWMGDCDWAPLHAAVAANNSRMVKLIMQFGGDETVRNSVGQTAFTLALAMNKNGSHKSVLQTLHEQTISSLMDRMSLSSDSREVSHDDDEW